MLGFIAVVILAGGGFFLVSNRNKPAVQTVTEEETVNSGALVPDESSPTVADTSVEETGSVKTFEIKASSFKFSLTEIRVKKGDRVKIVLNNTGGFHDWVIDEFDARTKQTQGPATETVEFTADKTGTFEYYCSVAQHRQNGMVGKLIVE